MSPGEKVGKTIMSSGAVVAVVGLVLIPVFGALIGGVVFLVGIVDFVIGMLFHSGRIGVPESSAAAEAEEGSAAADREADREANAAAYGTTADGVPITGDENPYARED